VGRQEDIRAHPEIRFGCDFDFSAATASDFTKSPQRSTLATFAGFLLIVLVSLENPKSRFQNEFPDVPITLFIALVLDLEGADQTADRGNSKKEKIQRAITRCIIEDRFRPQGFRLPLCLEILLIAFDTAIFIPVMDIETLTIELNGIESELKVLREALSHLEQQSPLTGEVPHFADLRGVWKGKFDLSFKEIAEAKYRPKSFPSE
jgi:hypothetical protein